MPFVDTTTGVNIHYEERGNGFPLVLVHGWSTSEAIWRFQGELSARYRLITVDLRGHGRSGAPAAGYALSDLAGDLVDLFVGLDLSAALLLGWSLGAQVALAAFPRLTERLSGLVLAGGTPRFTATDGWPWGLPVREPRGMGLGLRRDFHKTLGDFFRSMFIPGELSPEQEDRIAREIVKPGREPAPEAARATLDILATADLRELLPAIDRPVLLAHGTADPICLPAASRYMAGHLPAARLVEFDGAGHAPFLSRPEEFNRVVVDFFGEIHGGT